MDREDHVRGMISVQKLQKASSSFEIIQIYNEDRWAVWAAYALSFINHSLTPDSVLISITKYGHDGWWRDDARKKLRERSERRKHDNKIKKINKKIDRHQQTKCCCHFEDSGNSRQTSCVCDSIAPSF